MNIRCFTVGLFGTNVYLVRDPETAACAIVDTGESDELLGRLNAIDPRPDVRCILLTHAHLDHAGALSVLQQAYDVPTYCSTLERPMVDALPEQGLWFGMPELNRPRGRIDHWLADGDTIEVGKLVLRFLSTPGHSPGHGCYVADDDVLVGDLLFAGSIGRTDLPMGDGSEMQRSLGRLFELPPGMRAHTGHGPATMLEHELAENPFLGFLRRGPVPTGGKAPR